MRLYILFILAICSFELFGQGLAPNQIEPTTIEGGILKGKTKVYDEWLQDTVWFYAHDSIRYDSIYILNDTIRLRDGSGFVVIPDVDLSDYVKGSGTPTRVAFWSADSLSSNANLYWDNANSRLGLGLTIRNNSWN